MLWVGKRLVMNSMTATSQDGGKTPP